MQTAPDFCPASTGAPGGGSWSLGFTPGRERHTDCEDHLGTSRPNPETTRPMSKLTSLNALLIQEIKDLYSAENQLVKALPKMAKAATETALRDGFQKHLDETKVHAERLDRIATLLGASPKGKACKAMKGLVEEGAETIEEEGDPVIKDLALIAAAQRVEHYEISGYGTARAIAEALKLDEVAGLLQLTLEEESATDLTLTRLAEQLLPAAMGETADA